METRHDYLIKIELLLDEALNNLSPDEFEQLINDAKELIELYEY